MTRAGVSESAGAVVSRQAPSARIGAVIRCGAAIVDARKRAAVQGQWCKGAIGEGRPANGRIDLENTRRSGTGATAPDSRRRRIGHEWVRQAAVGG